MRGSVPLPRTDLELFVLSPMVEKKTCRQGPKEHLSKPDSACSWSPYGRFIVNQITHSLVNHCTSTINCTGALTLKPKAKPCTWKRPRALAEAENPPRNSLEKHLMASLLYRLYTSLVQNTQSYMKAAHQMRRPPTSTSHFISHLTSSPRSSTYRTPQDTSRHIVGGRGQAI
ncbi:hypothetical protein PM082_023265 [Marasmius tenuissimus]|nr:hypothetical protein PM082_023265 [Marasmius tenuissimus]